MFVGVLKKTQVWVAMALLLLCFSICPQWGYPHHQDFKDYLREAKENLDNNGEDTDIIQDEEEALEDEQAALEEVDDADTPKECKAAAKTRFSSRCLR